MASPLEPSTGVLCKLGSIVRHVEEGMSPTAHTFDWDVVRAMFDDPEVIEWLDAMDALALLPVKRVIANG